MIRECTEEVFLKDVAAHRLQIILDHGNHRHLRFSKGSVDQYFEIVTWPGFLCFSGDMGTYVFERESDMLEYFRGRAFNPGLWEEKLRATATHERGHRQYSEEMFVAAIKKQFDAYVAGALRPSDETEELWERIEDEVLSVAHEGEDTARREASNFEIEGDDDIFFDLTEVRLQAHTFHYLWCCYALPWAVAQYDAAKAAKP